MLYQKILNRKYLKLDNLAYLMFLSFPICYIAGSFVLNSAVFLSIIILFKQIENPAVFLKKKILKIFIIFSILLLLNFLNTDYKILVLEKFTLYFRFILFIFFVGFVMSDNLNKKNITYNYFLILSLFVSIDTLTQYILGKDIFGFSRNISYNRLSGPFGDELIVGSFLYVMTIVTFYFQILNNSHFKFYNYVLFPFFALVILLTGERNAFLSYLIFFILFIFLSKNFKLQTFITLTIILVLSYFLVKNVDFLKYKYSLVGINQNTNIKKINNNSKIVIKGKQNKIFNQIKDSQWFSHYRGAYYIFLENKFVGSGFKSYNFECKKFINSIKNKSIQCSTHPHNIYMQLLSDIGILGFFAFTSLISFYVYVFFKNRLFHNSTCTILFCLFISFVFPFKPHGSLFSTNFAFMLWFSFGLMNYEFFKNIFFKLK